MRDGTVNQEPYSKKTIIVDLDGTLCNCTHRIHYLNKPKRWSLFFGGIADDTLNQDVADFILSKHNDFKIFFSTGRPQKFRDVTVKWILKHNIPIFGLFMRDSTDFRRDDIVKLEHLQWIKEDGFDPFFVIDDKPNVCDMYRKEGLVVYEYGKEEKSLLTFFNEAFIDGNLSEKKVLD